MVLAPKVRVRTPVPVKLSEPVVIVWPLVSKDPAVRVIAAELPLSHASCTVQPPPTPLKVVALAVVFPFSVMVFPVVVASKVIAPV